MPEPIDLARVSCLGRLRRRSTMVATRLEIAGLIGIRSGTPVFLSYHLVSEGVLRSSVRWYHHEVVFSRSMVKSASVECHGSQNLRTSIGVSSF
jgi:hypothetical protein